MMRRVARIDRAWIILGLLVLVQAVVVRLVLERMDAAGALLALALSAALVLTVPRAGARIAASLAALRKRLAWWHGLWLLLFLSDLVFRIRDAVSIQDAPVDFWAGYRIALVVSAGFALLARLALGRGAWLRSLCTGIVKALALYCAVCIVSTWWSIFPQWTLYKSVEYLVDIAVLAAVVAEARSTEGYQSLFDWTWVLMGGLLLTVWAGILLWPDRALTRDVGMTGIQVEGVLPQISSNGVGELAAVLAMVALCRLVVRRRGAFYWLVFAACLVTLILSQTRSALLAFVFAVAVLLFFSRRVGLATFLVILLAVILAQTPAAGVFWKYFQRGQDRERLETLSGRTKWWTAAWEKYRERPWTGYGAYAGGRFAALADVQQDATSSLHNTYLEVLLGTGPWGLLPLGAALGGTWWLLLRALRRSAPASRERQLVLEALSVLSVVTLRSVFTTHLIWHPSLSFLLVLGYAEFLRRRPRAGANYSIEVST